MHSEFEIKPGSSLHSNKFFDGSTAEPSAREAILSTKDESGEVFVKQRLRRARLDSH